MKKTRTPKARTPRRRATTQLKTQSFETMARAAVARVSMIPSVTDLLDRDEEQAMVEAYIDQHCADDCKEALRAHAQPSCDSDHTHIDIVWIKEEIAFALGVEVGRRLAGGAK